MSDQPGGVNEQKALGGQAKASPREKEQQAALTELAKTKGGQDLTMRVKIYSPYHTYFDEPANSLSAENATGPFDILPHHHNFVSLLTPADLIVRRRDHDDRRFKIGGGVMHVKADR